METNQLLRELLRSVLFIFVATAVQAQSQPVNLKIGPQPDGSVLVPSNQLLRPAGDQIYLPGRPVDLALIREGQFLLVKNIKSLELIWLSDKKVVQSLPYSKGGSSFTGLSVSKDNQHIYLTEATGRILVAGFDNTNRLNWTSELTMPKPVLGGDPGPGGLALNGREDLLYVTLSRSNSLAVVKLKDQSVQEIPVGIAPYEVLLASDSKGYVTNWGGRRPEKGESTYNTSGSQVLVDPVTGVANNGSVSVIDLRNNKVIKEIQVGLHPSGMVLNKDRSLLYVACANSDQIFVLDTRKDEVKSEISVHLKKETPFGSAPNALALSPDGKYLYAANGTDNAICVIETGAVNKVTGYIPTGWYPGSVLLNEKGTELYVANVKGIGSRNKGMEKAGYNSRDHLGSISLLKVPDEVKLAEMTKQVVQNNNLGKTPMKLAEGVAIAPSVPVPILPTQQSPIKHVLYIIKENRTYDQVFGDLPQGNGDPRLTIFGRSVTPNQHRLAEEFLLFDNLYCDAEVSVDGHSWSNAGYATDFNEKLWPPNYGGISKASSAPAQVPSSGHIWDLARRKGLTYRSYGEYAARTSEGGQMDAAPGVEGLVGHVCPNFRKTGMRDTDNVAVFNAEFDGFVENYSSTDPKRRLPNFMVMSLGEDHTQGTRVGAPTPVAAVANNDWAIGQLVDRVSHSPYWKETAIFIIEDDAQNGSDHVDARRTIGLVLSPYSRRRVVDSTLYTTSSMLRSMELLLGLPPMTQFDAAATPMYAAFEGGLDLTPFSHLAPQVDVNARNVKGAPGSAESALMDFSDYDLTPMLALNEILWKSVKGEGVPMPLPIRAFHVRP